MKKSSSFVKHTLSGDEDNLYLCCCFKHGYSKPKCQNLHNVQLLFASVQRAAQISFRIFFKTRIMVDVAKFDSHDSDSQNCCWKKKIIKFCNRAEVASKTELAVLFSPLTNANRCGLFIVPYRKVYLLTVFVASFEGRFREGRVNYKWDNLNTISVSLPDRLAEKVINISYFSVAKFYLWCGADSSSKGSFDGLYT